MADLIFQISQIREIREIRGRFLGPMQKQYMVMKLARQIGSALNITPLAELLPWTIAEKLAAELRQADPESVYVIREVGAA